MDTLHRIALAQDGQEIGAGFVTADTLALLSDLRDRQARFCRRAYARPGRTLTGASEHLTVVQGRHLRRIANASRRRGTGIPALTSAYIPRWNWQQMAGALVVRFAPSKDDARATPAPQLAILVEDSTAYKPRQTLAIRLP